MSNAPARGIRFLKESRTVAELLQIMPPMYATDAFSMGAADGSSPSRRSMPAADDLLTDSVGHVTWKYCPLDDGSAMVCGASPVRDTLVVPASLGGLPVTEIAPRAFKGCNQLEEVVLPEGVRIIGDAAFANCKKLRAVTLPDSLEAVGAFAFNGDPLHRLRIPAGLRTFGQSAFATLNTGSRVSPSLAGIEVDPRNPVFYVQDGLLCMHGEDGNEWALLYGGTGETAEIPSCVNAIAPDCFKGVETVRTLVIHPGIDAMGTNAFFFGGGLQTICVRGGLESGRDAVIDFPVNKTGVNYARQCLQSGIPTAREIYALSDSTLLSSKHDFEAFKMICERLAQPFFLSEETEKDFCRLLNSLLPKVVRLFAGGNYLVGFDVLVSKGLINEENFDEILSWLSEEGEAPAVTRMLELKRTLLTGQVFDFDL